MTEKKIHWGIIGPGKIARKFAEDLKLVSGALLHAVASSSPARAQEFAQTHGAAHAFGTYEELLTCPNLDIVYVATPHSGHFENTMRCLQAGIPVLCEKPFAMNLDQVRSMVELAKDKQVFLMEALWSLFIPAVQKALKLVTEGQIGELHTVKSDFGYKSAFDAQSRIFNPKLGGGSLLDIGIYPALLALAALGKPHKSDILAQASFTQTQVDESCFFNFQYSNGKLAAGHSSIAATTPVEAFFYGTAGNIQLHTRWHHAQNLTLNRDGHEPESIHLPYSGWGYHFEIAHVQDCLRKGLLESPVATLQFSLDLMETLDNIREKIGLEYP